MGSEMCIRDRLTRLAELALRSAVVSCTVARGVAVGARTVTTSATAAHIATTSATTAVIAASVGVPDSRLVFVAPGAVRRAVSRLAGAAASSTGVGIRVRIL